MTVATEGGVEMIRIQIEGEAKEIAALVLELQERQGACNGPITGDEIIRRLRESQDQDSPAIVP